MKEVLGFGGGLFCNLKMNKIVIINAVVSLVTKAKLHVLFSILGAWFNV